MKQSKHNTIKTLTKAIICGAISLLSGCGLFWDDPYIAVTVTPLNWVEVHYYNATREPVRRVSVRVTGMGRVETRAGTSRRVSDSFAKDMSDATWDDFRRREYDVDPNHVRDVFQDLVNAGLFDKDKMFRETKNPSHGRFIAVRAAINNKTFSEPENIFESDPELAEQLLNLVKEFNRPVLGRRRPKPPTPPDETSNDKKDK